MSLSPPSQDWMVLQCGACGNRMKVRREVAFSSRLLCPGCHTPVPVQPDESIPMAQEYRPSPSPLPPASPPPEGSLRTALPSRETLVMLGGMPPPGRLPANPPATPSFLPTRNAAHPEFDGRPPEPEAELEEDEESVEDRHVHPEQRRRVKIKKRKTKRSNRLRYLELTDWDQNALTEIPEAEIAADIWAEVRPIPEDVAPAQQENEYVVESVDDEDGQTRTTKKKVRRRRLLLGARLLFLRFTWLSRYFTVALGVLVAGVGVYGFYVFRQKYHAPDLPPITEPPIDRAVLTHYDELGAEKTVRDFLAADGIEAKLAFVRQPERIRPLMKNWYRGERTAGPMTAGEVAMRDKKGGDPGSTRYYVILAMPVYVPDPLNPGSTYEEMTFFAIEELRDGPNSTYLVDWETSTGYQEIPLETYKATMPPEPWPFRIYMRSDDYYNHDFTELEWQCVALYYPGRDFHLYGYINRISLEGRKLLEMIAGGNRIGIIAELAYPPNPASRDQVIVQRMLHPSWFYDTSAEAARFGDAIEPTSSK